MGEIEYARLVSSMAVGGVLRNQHVILPEAGELARLTHDPTGLVKLYEQLRDPAYAALAASSEVDLVSAGIVRGAGPERTVVQHLVPLGDDGVFEDAAIIRRLTIRPGQPAIGHEASSSVLEERLLAADAGRGVSGDAAGASRPGTWTFVDSVRAQRELLRSITDSVQRTGTLDAPGEPVRSAVMGQAELQSLPDGSGWFVIRRRQSGVTGPRHELRLWRLEPGSSEPAAHAARSIETHLEGTYRFSSTHHDRLATGFGPAPR